MLANFSRALPTIGSPCAKQAISNCNARSTRKESSSNGRFRTIFVRQDLQAIEIGHRVTDHQHARREIGRLSGTSPRQRDRFSVCKSSSPSLTSGPRDFQLARLPAHKSERQAAPFRRASLEDGCHWSRARRRPCLRPTIRSIACSSRRTGSIKTNPSGVRIAVLLQSVLHSGLYPCQTKRSSGDLMDSRGRAS